MARLPRGDITAPVPRPAADASARPLPSRAPEPLIDRAFLGDAAASRSGTGSSLADEVAQWVEGRGGVGPRTAATQKLLQDVGQYDADLGLAFFQIRQLVRVTAPALARQFGCRADVIDALEAGAVHEFPPDEELARLLIFYAETAGVEPAMFFDRLARYRPGLRSVLQRIEAPSVSSAPLVMQQPEPAPAAVSVSPAVPAYRPVAVEPLHSPRTWLEHTPAVLPAYVPAQSPIPAALPAGNRQPPSHLFDVTPPVDYRPSVPVPVSAPQQPALALAPVGSVPLADVAPPQIFDPRTLGSMSAAMSSAARPTPELGSAPARPSMTPPRARQSAPVARPSDGASVEVELPGRPNPFGRIIERVRQTGIGLRIGLGTLVVALGLFFAGLWPSLLYWPLGFVPDGVRPTLQRVVDPVVSVLAPRRDGLKLIHVGDPRLRKGPRLPVAQR